MSLTVLKKDLSGDWYPPTSIFTRVYGIPPFEVIRPTVESDYSGTFNYRSADPGIASFLHQQLLLAVREQLPFLLTSLGMINITPKL